MRTRYTSRRNSLSIAQLRARRGTLSRAVIIEVMEARRLLSGTGLDFSDGFADTSGLVLNGKAQVQGTSLRMTEEVPSNENVGTVWSETPQDITRFSTQFSFQVPDPPEFPLGNLDLVFQRLSNTAGAGVLTGAGGYRIRDSIMLRHDMLSTKTGLFYIEEPFNLSSPISERGGTFDATSAGLDFRSGHVFTAALDYDGAELHQTITDDSTGATFTHTYTMDLPSMLGSSSAFVGFVGAAHSTNGISMAQFVQSWTYAPDAPTAAPAAPSDIAASAPSESRVALTWRDTSSSGNLNAESEILIERSSDGTNFTPLASVAANVTSYMDEGLSPDTVYHYRVRAANDIGSSDYSDVTSVRTRNVNGTDFFNGFANAAGLTLNGSAFINGSRLSLTPAVANQAGTAWTSTPKNITQFKTAFTFDLGTFDPIATGITFAIQGNSNTALGMTNGGTIGSIPQGFPLRLGYTGIPNSLAIKFTRSSTGLYLNGAIVGEDSGIGDPNHLGTNVPGAAMEVVSVNNVILEYDGATLALTIVDPVRGWTFRHSFAIDIPAVIGGDTAYVGFTGANGRNSGVGLVVEQSVLSWTYTAPDLAAAPLTPRELTATAVSGSEVDLRWGEDDVSEEGFDIERSTNGTDFTVIASVARSVTSYTDQGLTPDTQYHYRVRATNAAGASDPSNTAIATPPTVPLAPTGAQASAVTGNIVNLQWNDNAYNELEYRVYRRSGAEVAFALIGSAPADATGFTDDAAVSGTTNDYRIEAYNAAGTSSFAEGSVATPVGPPTEVTALGGLPFNGEVTIRWSPANGAVSYNLYRSTTSGDQGAVAYQTGLNGTSFTDTSVAQDTTYFYRLTTIGPNGETARSAEASTRHAGLVGSYFAIPDFDFSQAPPDDQAVFTRVDPAGPSDIGILPNGSAAFFETGEMGTSVIPNPGIEDLPTSSFWVRWEGTITSPATDVYQFAAQADDGVRGWIDGVAAFGGPFAPGGMGQPFVLTGGTSYPIVIEYIQAFDDASVKLEFQTFTHARQSVPLSWLSDAVAPPAAPANLHITDSNETFFDFAWEMESPNTATFTIEQSNDNINFVPIAVLTNPETRSHGVGDLAHNTTYYARVLAQNAAGSALSDVITYTTPGLGHSGASAVRYLFNEGTGTTVSDINVLGDQNPGTLIGDPLPQWVGGIGGEPRALFFNGDGQFNQNGQGTVHLADDLQPLLGGTATLAVWIKTEQSGGNVYQSPAIAGAGKRQTISGFNDNSISWGWLDENGHIGLSAGRFNSNVSAQPVNDGLWHLVVMTRDADSGALQIFVDGQLSGGGSGRTGAISQPIQEIGAQAVISRLSAAVEGYNYLNASLYDLRIYDRVLKPAEITDLGTAPPAVVDAPVISGTITRQLQATVNALQGAGDTYSASYVASTTEQLNSFLNGLDHVYTSPNVPPIEITLTAEGSIFSGQTFTVPPNMVLIINGATFVGASPSLTLLGGSLVLTNCTLTNSTDAPTIRVLGGSLTLRNTTVLESDQHAQAAIEVLGGTVDLGNADEPGNNTINVRGAGTVLGGSEAPAIDPAAGNVLEQNGQTATPVRFLQGMSWVDFNNDGNVDFGEQGLEGVSMTLSGSDMLGQTINLTTQTDASGIYTFPMLWPGNFAINKGATPAGYIDGKDVVGTLGGSNAVANRFSNIQVGTQFDGLAYNFAERPAPGSGITKDQSAGIGFWANKKGQALIGTFTNIGSWLAATLPHTFGVAAGANNLAGKTPQAVAAAYLQRFVLQDKLDAQVMATALSVYATRASLGGATAAGYGFQVSQYGLGNATLSVGTSGAAFGVANGATMTVLQVLQAWDQVADPNDWVLRHMAKDVFGSINGG